MSRAWEVIEFVPYLRYRWRTPMIACATALALTLSISLLLPKRYTATVTMSIDPPAGNDARIATTVSPVYLESLKGYEHVAAGDSLFARAVEHFHLNTSEPIESLKRRILKISKIRETRILEVSVTLPNPQVAHQFAQYIAQEAVTSNQEESLAVDRDRAEKVQRQLSEARLRLDKAAKDWPANATSSAIETLQSQDDTNTDLVAKLRRQLADVEADEAEYSTNSGNETRVAAARARAGVLKRTLGDIEREIAANRSTIEAASSRRELAEAELNVAQSEYAGISNRLRDLQAAAGGAGEKLRIIDPGIVPQRSSFPNTPLNVFVAIVCAATSSIIYIAVAFSYERRRIQETLFR